MTQQQGDVLLYQTNDGGTINIENGLVEMSGGLETAAYLSLFGGNEQDDGRKDNPLQFWGNYSEDIEHQYRSETQYLLRSIPAIPVNLRRIEEAAARDLAWLVAEGAATSIGVTAAIPNLNTVDLTIAITANGVQSVIQYVENWKADI